MFGIPKQLEEKFEKKLMEKSDLKTINKFKSLKQAVQEDIQQYGDQQSGVYKGIRWLAQRKFNKYWCGYITRDDLKHITQEVENEMERCVHGGFTADLGFDCAHAGDFIGFLWNIDDNAEFRRFPYVLQCLENAIDAYYVNADPTFVLPQSV